MADSYAERQRRMEEIVKLLERAHDDGVLPIDRDTAWCLLAIGVSFLKVAGVGARDAAELAHAAWYDVTAVRAPAQD